MAPRWSKKGKGKHVVEETPAAPDPIPAVMSDGILEVIPEPIARLDMSDIDNIHTNYVECLKKITEAVSSDIKFTLVEDEVKRVVPVTEGSDHTSNGAFTIELVDGELRLLIVCDKYQMWFRGIVTGAGSRYEIDIVGPKAMVGSESLNTNGSYPNLIGDSVHLCKIGFQSLLSAFRTLAGYDGITLKPQRTAIAVILVMFFEAPRLQELYDLSLRLLEDKADELVGETNKDLINNWANTSRDFYQENGAAVGEIKITASTGSATKKVAKSVRILCRSPWDRWVEKKQ